MTIHEVADYLRVSTLSIKRYIQRGELEASKEPRPNGYRWKIEFQDLYNYLVDLNGEIHDKL